MNHTKKLFLTLFVLCMLVFSLAATVSAHDVGSWTKNIAGYASWEADVTREKYVSNEDAVFNVTHPNAYIYWHGTTNGTSVYMEAWEYPEQMEDNYHTEFDFVVNDNNRECATWYPYYYTGTCKLHIYNYHSSMVDTKGTWAPDSD